MPIEGVGKTHDAADNAVDRSDAAFELAVNEGASTAVRAIIDAAGKQMAAARDALRAHLDVEKAASAA
jgi:hypothetical protein